MRGPKGNILDEETAAETKAEKWEQVCVFRKMSHSSVRGGKGIRLRSQGGAGAGTGLVLWGVVRGAAVCIQVTAPHEHVLTAM